MPWGADGPAAAGSWLAEACCASLPPCLPLHLAEQYMVCLPCHELWLQSDEGGPLIKAGAGWGTDMVGVGCSSGCGCNGQQQCGVRLELPTRVMWRGASNAAEGPSACGRAPAQTAGPSAAACAAAPSSCCCRPWVSIATKPSSAARRQVGCCRAPPLYALMRVIQEASTGPPQSTRAV